MELLGAPPRDTSATLRSEHTPSQGACLVPLSCRQVPAASMVAPKKELAVDYAGGLQPRIRSSPPSIRRRRIRAMAEASLCCPASSPPNLPWLHQIGAAPPSPAESGCWFLIPDLLAPPPHAAASTAEGRPLFLRQSFERIRSVRSRSSSSRIVYFMDSFFFQAGSQVQVMR